MIRNKSISHKASGAATEFIIFLCITVMLVLTSCKQKQETPPQTSESVKLAAFQLYASAPIVAAERSAEIDSNMHCFQSEGLSPTIIKRAKGPDIIDALVSGSADFGTLAVTPIVLQALQGKELVIFATLMTTDHDIKVLGHKSAGIKSAESLKGKRVGYIGGTFGEIFLNKYLDKHGIKKTEISLISAAPAQLRDLFLSKSVDAIIIWEPIVQDILTDKGVDQKEIFLDVDKSLYTGTINLVARPEVLKAKRQAAQKLVKAMICGESLIDKNPDKVRALLESWLDRKPGTLTNVFEKNVFHIQLDAPFLIRGLKEEATWAREAVFSGKAKMPDDFSRFIDTSIMQAVAPDRLKK